MKKLIVLLLLSHGAFAQHILKFQPEYFSFKYDSIPLKPGQYEGKDTEGRTRLKLLLEDSKKVKKDFPAQQIFCSDGEIVDSSGAVPAGQVELYFPNGKLNAKGSLFPAFKRKLVLLKKVYISDTLYNYDDDGNSVPKTIVYSQHEYSSTPDEYLLLPYGEWTYYDIEGNITAKTYFSDLDLTTIRYYYMNYRGFYFAYPSERIKGWEINYDSTDNKKIRQEKYYNRDLQVEERKIYFDDVVVFHQKPTNVNAYKELWFSPDGKTCTREVNYVNDYIEGFYFSGTAKGDTLESGFFNKNNQDGNWKKYDSLKNISFTGSFENGTPVGVHRYYQKGILQKSSRYIKYIAKDSLPHLRVIKYDTILDNGTMHSYRDSIVFSVLKDSLFNKEKLKQVIDYDPYHRWDYYTSRQYYHPNDPWILDGVYIPEKPTKISIPEFDYKQRSSNEHAAIFRKRNFNAKGKQESEIRFRNGLPYQGVDLMYFDNSNLKSYTAYEKGKITNALRFTISGELITANNSGGKQDKNGREEKTYYKGYLMGPFKINSNQGGYSKGNYTWGYENGWKKVFDKKDRLLAEGNMYFSVADGVWTGYDTLGKITKTEEYILGEKLGFTHKESIHANWLIHIYEGNFVRSHYEPAVFGYTVPEGKVFYDKQEGDSAAVYSHYCQDCWEETVPVPINFQSISNHDFVVNCKQYQPLKWGEEKIKEYNHFITVFNHRAKKDSTYYFWTTDEFGIIEEAFCIQLAPDFRFVSTDSLNGGLKKVYFEEPNGTLYKDKRYYDVIGKFTMCYPNGQPMMEFMQNHFLGFTEKREKTKSWYPSGQLKFEGEFVEIRGSQLGTGKHLLYYENGAIQEERIFNDTSLIVTIFQENGQKFSSGTYANELIYRNSLYNSWYFEIPVNHAYQKEGWQIYYDSIGKEIKRELYAANVLQKQTGKNLYGSLGTWQALPLDGCDATSFYIDENKNYWLGTGSSGGVYFSSDKGKTWTAKNKGIGPVHVERIGKYDGKMYIVIPSTSEQQPSKIYTLNKEEWIYFGSDEDFPEIVANLDAAVKTKSAKIPFATDTLRAEYNLYYWDHANRYMEKYIDGYAQEIKARDSSVILPYTFLQPGGNYIPENDSSGVYYGKTGVYYWAKDSLFSKTTKGLNATDIREVISDKNKNIWAIAGLGDVWKYGNNEWSLVFDFIAHKKSAALQTSSGLTLINDGIYFCSLGGVWKISNDSVELFSKKDWPLETISSFSGISADDFFINGVQPKNAEEGSNDSYSVFHFSGEKFTRVTLQNSDVEYWKSMIKTSPTGESWLFDGKNILNLSTGQLFVTQEKETIYPAKNLIAFNNKGDMVCVLREDILLKWSKEKGFHSFRVEELRGLVSVALSDDGKLYAGTGFDYIPACGVMAVGQAHGLFLLTENNTWTEIKNNINPWIMSLSFLDQKTLMVGTSGTGLYLYHLKK